MKNIICVLITASLLFFTANTWAASTKEEVIRLQEQVKAMQKDLDEIKKLLQQPTRPAPAPRAAPVFKEQEVSIGASPFMGETNATVTLIEYSDYQCPYCARHYRVVMPTLVSEYIETGKLKYVMRENPIPALHRQAFNASLAALCAGDQDKYWDMHNLLFDNQKTLTVDSMKSLGEGLGLDTAAFNECLDSEKYKDRVNEDLASGAKLGVSGTPGFVIGLTDPDDPDKADMKHFIRGAQSLDNFKSTIDGLLGSAE